MDLENIIRRYIKKKLTEGFINASGEYVEDEETSNTELNNEDVQRYLFGLITRYKIGADNYRQLNNRHAYEYWFPMEAKAEIDKLGIDNRVEMATNKEHPDYGKKFVVFDFWWDSKPPHLD